MSQSRGRWWRRALLVLAVGPGAISALNAADDFFLYGIPRGGVALCACAGALWGLTAGILRKSLMKSIIGLNLGAALGAAWFAGQERFARIYFAPPDYVYDAWIFLALSLFTLCGALLGAGLNVNSKRLLVSSYDGAFAGFLGFGAMAFILYLEVNVRLVPSMDLEPLRTFAFCSFPVSVGLWLFYWLIADFLPHREQYLYPPSPPA